MTVEPCGPLGARWPRRPPPKQQPTGSPPPQPLGRRHRSPACLALCVLEPLRLPAYPVTPDRARDPLQCHAKCGLPPPPSPLRRPPPKTRWTTSGGVGVLQLTGGRHRAVHLGDVAAGGSVALPRDCREGRLGAHRRDAVERARPPRWKISGDAPVAVLWKLRWPQRMTGMMMSATAPGTPRTAIARGDGTQKKLNGLLRPVDARQQCAEQAAAGRLSESNNFFYSFVGVVTFEEVVW